MKQKNEYNQKLENDIVTKISKYLDKHSKIELRPFSFEVQHPKVDVIEHSFGWS
jgi:uncharacterized protein (DUF2164 family)